MLKLIAVGTSAVTIEGTIGNYTVQHIINRTAPCGYDLGLGQVVASAHFRTQRGALAWAHRKLESHIPAGELPLFATTVQDNQQPVAAAIEAAGDLWGY
jgi:hypothetical protein